MVPAVELKVSSRSQGDHELVIATGEIDLTNAEGLRDALLSALNAGAPGLVVDMTTTTFLDSAGVTALVRASRRAAASDATLRLAVTGAAVVPVALVERMRAGGAGLASLISSVISRRTSFDSLR